MKARKFSMVTTPAILNGVEPDDALQRFVTDYLVGMLDEVVQPLVAHPAESLRIDRICDHGDFAIELVTLAPGWSIAAHAANGVDVVEMDLFAPSLRIVDGHPVTPATMVGQQAVRINAGQQCARSALPETGAAWLSFQWWRAGMKAPHSLGDLYAARLTSPELAR